MTSSRTSARTPSARGNLDTYMSRDVLHPFETSLRLLCLQPGWEQGMHVKMLPPPLEPDVSLEKAAIVTGAASVALDAVKVGRMLTWEMPRGLPWSDFPIYSKPYNRVDKRKAMDLAAALLAYGHHVVCNGSRAVTKENSPLSAGKRALHRLECGELLALIGNSDSRQERTAAKVYLTDMQGKIVDTDIDDLRNDALCDASFHYSYKVNALAILGRALREAVKVPTMPCVVSEIMMPWQGLYFMGKVSQYTKPVGTSYIGSKDDVSDSTLSNPYFVQILHALRNVGHADISHLLSSKTYPAWSLSDEEGSWEETVRYTLDTRNGGFVRARGLSVVAEREGRAVWMGTGKHTPVVMAGKEWMKVDCSMPGKAWASIDEDILSCGLATVNAGAGTLSISHRGERFLDLLHPDCMDPDILCRWRDGGQLILPRFSAESEAWIHRFFRKAKAAVNTVCTA